jgi:hypothetical protein
MISEIINRVSRVEQALEQQVKKVQYGFSFDLRQEIEQKVKKDRQRKWETFHEVLDSGRSEQVTKLQSAEALEDFEESLKGLKVVEPDLPEEQKRRLGEAGSQVLRSGLDFVEQNLLKREVASRITDQSKKELLELRNRAERMWRLTLLKYPSNEDEFEAAIMWVSERGEDIELATLRSIKDDFPYDSPDIQKLVYCAEAKIVERQQKEARSYKVFCSKGEFEQNFQGVKVIEEYSDFIKVSSLRRTISEIEKFYPVESCEFDVRGLVANEAIAFAIVKDHESEQAFLLNQGYQLQAGVENKSSDFKGGSAQELNYQELIKLEIVVWAEGMEIESDWIKPYMFSCTQDTPPIEFKIKPFELGTQKIRVEFLYQRHWLAEIEFDVEVIESPVSVSAM